MITTRHHETNYASAQQYYHSQIFTCFVKYKTCAVQSLYVRYGCQLWSTMFQHSYTTNYELIIMVPSDNYHMNQDSAVHRITTIVSYIL